MFKNNNYQSPLGSPLKQRGVADENNSPMNSPLKQPRNLPKYQKSENSYKPVQKE